MTDEIPQWALERAAELANKEMGEDYLSPTSIAGTYVGTALARYIAQHEEPPVGPMLIEARELAAKHYEQVGSYILADATRSGERDSLGLIKVIAEALRRGIELGKAGAA